MRKRLPHPPPKTFLYLGPAFVASIAYVDPGNFATNISGGAKFGFTLLWVIFLANLMAILIQNLSGKLGLATGANLAELCRKHFPRPVTWGLWVQAELVAMATDIAEFIGAALALSLLFDIPLPVGGLITAAVASALLVLRDRGYRGFELAIVGMLGIILIGFIYNLIGLDIDIGSAGAGLVPGFAGQESLLLATGIIGATVMPHVIYLHSALSQQRAVGLDNVERRSLLRIQRIDIGVAMGIAGVVNMLMLIIAATLFFDTGVVVETIEQAHAGFSQQGQWAALAFALALLASGFASASVGTLSGQVVMQGFINRTIPVLARRLITMTPAMILLIAGVDPTQALVLSQVVLSFGIPFALIPLLLLTRREDIMGSFVNRGITSVVVGLAVAIIVALNLFLLAQTLLG